MKRAALSLFLFLILARCASAPRSASWQPGGENPAMHCEASCQGCIQCTALYVGDAWPHWTAEVKEGGQWVKTFSVNGLSVAIPVDRRQTLVTMWLKINNELVPKCRALFRRPMTTGGFEHEVYEAEP